MVYKDVDLDVATTFARGSYEMRLEVNRRRVAPSLRDETDQPSQ